MKGTYKEGGNRTFTARRFCKKCGEFFQPPAKLSKVCQKCMDKLAEDRKGHLTRYYASNKNE